MSKAPFPLRYVHKRMLAVDPTYKESTLAADVLKSLDAYAELATAARTIVREFRLGRTPLARDITALADSLDKVQA